MFSCLFSLFAPHYCCSCGRIGAILCESCFNDIISARPTICVACKQQTRHGYCNCSTLFSRSWCVGWHDGALQTLIAESKFSSVREAADYEALLLARTLPDTVGEGICVVPVPTIARHRRVRGYAHAERVAKQLARKRHLRQDQLVMRTAQYVQHGATKAQRHKQAQDSYALTATSASDTTYLLVDDVYTTGATIRAIAQLLRDAGVPREQVWVAVVAVR